jgi:hypothetical protein
VGQVLHVDQPAIAILEGARSDHLFDDAGRRAVGRVRQAHAPAVGCDITGVVDNRSGSLLAERI